MLEALENDPMLLAWQAYVDWLVLAGWPYETAQQYADHALLQLAIDNSYE